MTLPQPTMPTIYERIAMRFHEEYEALAPRHGYKTRDASAVPWPDVPEQNRALMEAVVKALCEQYFIEPGPNA